MTDIDLNKMTKSELKAMLKMMDAAEKQAKKQAAADKRGFAIGHGLYLKVSVKGALSIGGLTSRFPTTLYINQIIRVLDESDAIRAFITANLDKFSVKPPKAVDVLSEVAV